MKTTMHPKLDDVDPQTYEVFVDGEKSPVSKQQNYHLLKDTYSRGMHK